MRAAPVHGNLPHRHLDPLEATSMFMGLLALILWREHRVPGNERRVDLPGGSDGSIDVKHHLAAPLNVGDGFAEGGEPIGRCDRYSNHA